LSDENEGKRFQTWLLDPKEKVSKELLVCKFFANIHCLFFPYTQKDPTFAILIQNLDTDV